MTSVPTLRELPRTPTLSHDRLEMSSWLLVASAWAGPVANRTPATEVATVSSTALTFQRRARAGPDVLRRILIAGPPLGLMCMAAAAAGTSTQMHRLGLVV